VAKDLANRLHLALELVIVDADTMLTGSEAGQWDVALPSVASWSIDGSRFLASDPYYSWPHFLVVSAASAARSASDVAQGPVCAVAGGAGDAWLRGSYGTRPGLAVTGSIVAARSDDECMSMIASGAAMALVTERLTSGDLQLLNGIRVIGGPSAESRSAIVARPGGADPQASDLLRAIDDALAQMHADGTLTRLSESRFGGVDLTTP
jgi:L-cystine transport system substrate-binding protein